VAVPLLAVAFWRPEFAAEFANQHGGDIAALTGGDVADATVAAVFSMRLLLVWIAPFLLTLRLVPHVAIATTIAVVDSATACLLEPLLLGLLLTHEGVAMMLAVVYFHTGYATVLLLVTNGLGTLFSVMGFLQVRRISAGDRFFCRCTQKQVLWLLGALELACAVALAIQISDGWLMSFLAVTAALAIYLPFVAVLTLVEALEEMLAQRGTRRRAEVAAAKADRWAALSQLLSEARTRAVELGAWRCVGCVICFFQCLVQLGSWLFEVREARNKQELGARIKWRRLCLLLGTFGLVVDGYTAVRDVINVSPWDDLRSELTYLTGQECLISIAQGRC
jgi:hypothetical protein